MVPTDGLGVHPITIGMAGCLQWQYCAPSRPALGIDGHPPPLGKTGRPIADRSNCQASAGRHPSNHGTQGIEVNGNGPVQRISDAAFQCRPNGPPPGDIMGNTLFLQFLTDIMDNLIGVAGWTVNIQQFDECLLQVVDIDGNTDHG